MASEILLKTEYIIKMNAVINYSDYNFAQILNYGSPLQWSMNLLSFHRD